MTKPTLTQLLQERKWKMRDLANAAGISRATIYYMLNNPGGYQKIRYDLTEVLRRTMPEGASQISEPDDIEWIAYGRPGQPSKGEQRRITLKFPPEVIAHIEESQMKYQAYFASLLAKYGKEVLAGQPLRWDRKSGETQGIRQDVHISVPFKIWTDIKESGHELQAFFNRLVLLDMAGTAESVREQSEPAVESSGVHNPVESTSELLTVSEVAAQLHVDNSTVREWIEEGVLRAIPRTKHHTCYIKRDVLNAFLSKWDIR